MTRRHNGGFTIVEIMIVLAVTGALFLSAVLLINGKQNVTAFNQSIHNIQTQMQQVVNDVGSGYYPSKGNLSCDMGGPAGGLKLTSLSTEQGANLNCIFLGKVVQFGLLATDPQEFNVYTMAGLRGSAAVPTTDLLSAKARVVAPGTVLTDVGVPDVTDNKKLLYGLTVSQMYYNANPANKIGAVGFTSSISSLGSADGSQQVNMVAIPGTTLGVDKPNGVNQINTNLAASIVNPPNGIQICFNSGGTTQSGLITLGGDGRQGTVDLQLFSNKDCV